ncbi:MAG: asparaginase [Lentilitoribacter sp.]
MSNPVLVELTRGNLVESAHRGAFAVCDASGKVLHSKGDIQTPIFPRSAVKAIQALFLMESGAADAYGFGDKELAMACASHSSEPEHANLAEKMLMKAGLSEQDLECGAHWSFDHKTLISQAKSGLEPTQFHNNCSGKHAGFLCAACHSGIGLKGYVTREHEVQKIMAHNMEAVTGGKMVDELCGTDGCAIPTFAVPLEKIAQGFARLATGEGLSNVHANGAQMLIKACMAEPFYVAGTARACTKLMEMAPGRIFAKTGAEGVYTAILPEQGLGFALKIDCGTTRAAEVAIAALLAKVLGDDDPAYDELIGFATRDFSNWNGQKVGAFQFTQALK